MAPTRSATISVPWRSRPRWLSRAPWHPSRTRLGIDYNGDGAGNGFGVSSLLGIHAVPPYGHNGACETLACVVGDVKHRTANFTMLPDRLGDPVKQRRVVRFLESIDAQTKPFP